MLTKALRSMDPAADDREDTLAERKRALRQGLLARRRGLDPHWVEQASADVEARCRALLSSLACRHVGCYMAMASEVQTAPLMDWCRAGGMTLYVPVWDAGCGAYRMALAEGPMRAGPMGIAQPVELRPVDLASTLDLIFVPGVAFDAQGGRLGHGAGHYDRLLAPDADRPVRVGLAFDFQMIERVPCGPDDVAMHIVITNKECVAPVGRAAP